MTGGRKDRPENTFCGYIYGPSGLRHDLLDQWGDVVVIDNFRNMIDRGYAWLANYDFNLLQGETKYLVFRTSCDCLHATNRVVNVIDRDNAIIEVKVATLRDATITTLGNDLSNTKIYNANFNMNLDNIPLEMWDETSVVNDTDAIELPFTRTIVGDRKQASSTFIQDEYVLEQNEYLVIRFENQGNGEVTVEYSSNGYRAYHDSE